MSVTFNQICIHSIEWWFEFQGNNENVNNNWIYEQNNCSARASCVKRLDKNRKRMRALAFEIQRWG